MPPKPRRLVLDEQLPWRLAEELRNRGFRDATSAVELHQTGKKDPEWLAFLANLGTDYVLVTFDNKMPVVHRADLLKHRSTVAIIDSKGDRGGLTEAEYYRDVVHRFAPRMAIQRGGDVRKYWRAGHRLVRL